MARVKASPPPTLDPIASLKERGVLTQPWLDWLEDLSDAAHPPSCHVYFTANQSIANATSQDVLWTAEDHDNSEMHSTASNTDRITIPSAGVYCAGFHLGWAASAVGYRQVAITLNDPAPPAGSANLTLQNPVATSYNNNSPYFGQPVTRALSAGDVLRVVAYQNSGGALNAIGTSGAGPYANGFWCFRVSK